MADQTGIEWTDATWNPVAGCAVVSPGCTNCYAMKMAARLAAMGQAKYQGLTQPSKAGPVWTGKITLDDSALTQPLRWKRPRMVFVDSMSDLFHENVPDAFIDKVFAVMALTPQHTYQLLTKRADRMRDYLRSGYGFRVIDAIRQIAPPADGKGVMLSTRNGALPNVWLGVSVEDQKHADERIPLLLDTPAAVRWISAEPLLGPIDITGYLYIATHADDAALACGCEPNPVLPVHDPATTKPEDISTPRLDWVVVGGESGPDARPMHPDWARSIRDQCAAAGVPFFFKQWGEYRPIYDRDRDDPDWRRCNDIATESPNGQWLNLAGGQGFHGDRVVRVQRLGKKAAGHALDFVEHREFPR